MFAFTRRRPARPAVARPAVVRQAAAFEPLESRQLLSVTPFATAGLTLTATKSTLPSAQLAGAKLKGAVTVSLTNGLTVNDTGTNTFTLYAAVGTTPNSSTDVQLGQVAKRFTLKPGKSITVTIPVKNIAAPATDGTYNVLAEAVDSSGDTSTVATAPTPTLTVEPANVALTANVGTVSPNALTAGKTVTFKVVLINNGNINSTGLLTANIGLALQGSGVITLPLVSKPSSPTIKEGGKGVSFTYHVKIPTTIAPGAYNLGVSFTQGSAAALGFSPTLINVGS